MTDIDRQSPYNAMKKYWSSHGQTRLTGGYAYDMSGSIDYTGMI